jgi:hypothetical protein
VAIGDLLPTLAAYDYDLRSTYHADAILSVDFADALSELDALVGQAAVPITEIVGGGGGETQLTQRIRRLLAQYDWHKHNFEVEKRIDEYPTYAATHEVDHVKRFDNGTIALEIEWNNKDPFFDRDLDNFQRLHADGAISLGVIITRGASFQNGIQNLIREYAYAAGFQTADDLARADMQRTRRQIRQVEQLVERSGFAFPDAWAKVFTSDKFGTATTHWDKLDRRLVRGVGSPCPILAIGIPLGVVTRDAPS